ncbi:right-handed parallel beta-helix repeat-containing protein [Planctomonas sp. JC2975]|uniref:beta strand repeat-containing protein n=1 Tax=Planctomonas sp. JC2975 TaxID=2729626 RepID=UPI001474C2D7|nr:right-handed parallel beta-helix repeat-containing protein [Planctomonas sp. JC2975]NNC14073.1 right-handed parallel beta-helix repeat-containing protein [Planctomonas sp. JC2975]
MPADRNVDRRSVRWFAGVGAIVLGSAAWVFVGVSPADAAVLDIRAVCTDSTTVGSTITLTADCTTTDNLTIPDGFTLDGAGHTITVTDTPSAPLLGAAISNAGSSMSIQNLTLNGEYTAAAPNPADSNAPFFGIRFLSASGSLSNVTVTGITRGQTFNFGQAIQVDATAGGPQTVTATNVSVSDFQKNGLTANGEATLNVTGSTLGPPDTSINTAGVAGIAQNSVQYFGSGGTFSGNTVIGYTANQPSTGSASTGMLIFTANNLTVTNNTFGGAGTDYGILLSSGGTGITISFNHLARTATPSGLEDSFGFGAGSFGTTATLICNTFDGWNQNLQNLTQPPCIITPSLHDGTVGVAYSDVIEATTENPTPDLTWTVLTGDFPPGLTLNPDGTITGTPTTAGTYTFTAQVEDPVDGTATREYTITIAAAAPGLSMTKTASAASATGEPVDQLSTAGDVVTYTFHIVNSGNVPLSNLAINDGGTYTGATTPGFSGTGTLGPITCSPTALGATIAAGASTDCTATYTVTQADINNGGSLNNTATASGQQLDSTTFTSQPATASIPVNAATAPPTPTGPTPGVTGVLANTGSTSPLTALPGSIALLAGAAMITVSALLRKRRRA